MLVTDRSINTYQGTETRALTFQTDTKEHTVTYNPSLGSFTVTYDTSSRSMGKTFYSRQEMIDHYSSIKGELKMAADKLEAMGN